MKTISERISYQGQSSGEYFIYVDGKFRMSSDNYHELKEDLEEIEKELEEEEGRKNKEESSN